MDSTTTLAIAKAQGFTSYALSFRYGQRHHVELEAASRVAKAMEVSQHVVVDIDLRRFGGSALTANVAVPKGRSAEAMSSGIPVIGRLNRPICLDHFLDLADWSQTQHESVS